MLQKSEKLLPKGSGVGVGGRGYDDDDNEPSHDSKKTGIRCWDETPEIETIIIIIMMTFSCPN